MSRVLLLADTRADSGYQGQEDQLRPLPVWCPLPRTAQQPKVPAIGWAAGRTTSVGSMVRLTTSWTVIETAPPSEIVSNPRGALQIERTRDYGDVLFALRTMSDGGANVADTFCAERRFPRCLDLGAMNDRRHRVCADGYPKRFPSGPMFGRAAVRLDGTASRAVLDSQLVHIGEGPAAYVVQRGTGTPGHLPQLLESLEGATARAWLKRARAEVERRGLLAKRFAVQGTFDAGPLLVDLDETESALLVSRAARAPADFEKPEP